ncbi:MAG: M23 family peptidase [Sphingobacteriia bacterium]|nr:M23 family peptidase [Sphingobacteriia bacterium]
MAKVRYYYDTETCTYEKEPLTVTSFLREAIKYTTGSLVLGGLLFWGASTFLDSPKESLLRQQNDELHTQLQVFTEKLEKVEARLEEIHQKDNQLYRSILNEKEIASSLWDAGTGGAEKYTELSTEALNQTAHKLDQLTYKLELQSKSLNKLMATSAKMKEKLERIPSIRPVAGGVLSGFGHRFHPINKVRHLHTGIDFVAKIGTPVLATADGTVVLAGIKGNGYGIHVDINHGYGYLTKYAHLSKVTVKEGQKIKRGQVIGYTGNTGLSKGPHLHYEIEKNGAKINPIDYFNADLSPEQYVHLRKEADSENESMD